MNAARLVDEDTASDPIAPIHSLLASQPAALRPVDSAEINYRVLLLEGERGGESLLAEAVRAEIPDAGITRAAGVLGALALSELYTFNLLIIDATLSADLAKELTIGFQKCNPKAEVIVMDLAPETDGTMWTLEFPRIHILSAPINPLELIEIIRGCRDRAEVPKTAVEEEDEGYFVVVLSRHTPMEVLQLKCLAGATTALDVMRRDAPGGRIWFARGQIVHAETGVLRGEDALIEMINWPGGSIVEVSVPPPAEFTINEPWTSLLMRAAHAADERNCPLS